MTEPHIPSDGYIAAEDDVPDFPKNDAIDIEPMSDDDIPEPPEVEEDKE